MKGSNLADEWNISFLMLRGVKTTQYFNKSKLLSLNHCQKHV